MANDIEGRVTNLEIDFKDYMAIFYKWLDETRQDMKEMRRQHEERMLKLEQHEGMIIQLLQAMDEKLDNHEDRLSSGGL